MALLGREQPIISIHPTYYTVHHVSSCDKRTSYVPCLQLLLTVWAGRVTINILPDDVLLLIFHFDRVTYLDRLRDYRSTVASVLEVASVSSCVPEVAIRRFCVAKISRPETCLRS